MYLGPEPKRRRRPWLFIVLVIALLAGGWYV